MLSLFCRVVEVTPHVAEIARVTCPPGSHLIFLLLRFPSGVAEGGKVTEETMGPKTLPASILRAWFGVVEVWCTSGSKPPNNMQMVNADVVSSRRSFDGELVPTE